MAKILFIIRIIVVGMITLLASVCYAEKPVFVPPAERALPQSERPWEKNTFVVIAYHDIEDNEADQRYLAARTSALSEQFAWLHDNRYNVISVDQILAARNGGEPLPNKAVLFTFDDGYSSFYRRVYPLLKAYNWHAVLAPVGTWLDTPANKNVDFGGLSTPRDRFTTWKQITELSQSGLIEIGAHTYASHYGVLANPQGNTEPAAANLIYDAKTKTYETEAAFKQRMEKDVSLITERIIKATGKQPRAWVWPYGAANGTVLNILRQHGYQLAMTLEPGIANVNDLMNIPRILISNNPSLKDFALTITSVQEKDIMRVAHVDLDYLYDPDPIQEKENLDKLVQRIADLRVTTVFLQAFSDPKGDGNIRQVYFPNRWIPMRQDLFNRVTWQLSSRSNVKVYAWMPVLAFEMDPSLPRIKRIDPKTGKTSIDPDQYRRLSPFNPEVRQRIIDIYRDMAYSAPIDGVLYHDDAVMSDFEDASPDGIRAYEKAGFPGSIATIRQDPEMMQRWTRYFGYYPDNFITGEPPLKDVRPVLSSAWYPLYAR